MTLAKTRILVSGANGQVARELEFLSSNFEDYEFEFLPKEFLDISNIDEVHNSFARFNPEIFINCAAFTGVDLAEEQTDLAFLINGTACKNLATTCSEFNCILIHLSSDYVYHNDLRRPLKETDPTNPKGIYAHSKLEGENLILSNWEKSIIIRSSWIYSSFGNNFVKTMVQLTSEKKELRVVDDQIGAPTYARDLAQVILNNIINRLVKSMNNDLFGIYNFSNRGQTSWFELAKTIVDIRSADCIIHPISTSEFNAPAPRPAYSVMDNQKIKKYFHIEYIPHWKDSLVLCMSELNN